MIHERYTKAIVGAVALTLVVSVLAASGAAFSAHQETATQTQDTSYLRIAHMSPDAPAVDVMIDNETVVEGAQFGNVTGYLALPADTYNATITIANQSSSVLFEGNLTLEPRTVGTLAATGEYTTGSSTEFQPLLFEDDAWEPANDTAAVSLVHLSPDAPAVDVVVTAGPTEEANGTATPGAATETTTDMAAGNGSMTQQGSNETALARNLTFGNGSDYLNVQAGNYTVEIRSNETGDVLATANLSVEGGTAYSVFAAGYANPDEAPAGSSFTVIPVEDATMSVSLPEMAADNATATEMPGTETGTDTAGTETTTDTAGTETTTDTAGTETTTDSGAATDTATTTETA